MKKSLGKKLPRLKISTPFLVQIFAKRIFFEIMSSFASFERQKKVPDRNESHWNASIAVTEAFFYGRARQSDDEELKNESAVLVDLQC